MKRKGSSGEQTDVKGTKRRRREKKSESESSGKKVGSMNSGLLSG